MSANIQSPPNLLSYRFKKPWHGYVLKWVVLAGGMVVFTFGGLGLWYDRLAVFTLWHYVGGALMGFPIFSLAELSGEVADAFKGRIFLQVLMGILWMLLSCGWLLTAVYLGKGLGIW